MEVRTTVESKDHVVKIGVGCDRYNVTSGRPDSGSMEAGVAKKFASSKAHLLTGFKSPYLSPASWQILEEESREGRDVQRSTRDLIAVLVKHLLITF